MRLVTNFTVFCAQRIARFPFLFGGTFIEAISRDDEDSADALFPFLFGGTFIEAEPARGLDGLRGDFPSFSEGLSLRHKLSCPG